MPINLKLERLEELAKKLWSPEFPAREADYLVEDIFQEIQRTGAKPQWRDFPKAAAYYRARLRKAAEAGAMEDPEALLDEALGEYGVDAGDVATQLEVEVESLANSQAAMAWSTPTDDLVDEFGGEVWIEAEFGDWVAVNGDPVLPGRPERKRPAGYVLTNRGGRIPAVEEEVQVDFALDAVAAALKIPVELVDEVAAREGYKDFAYVSVSGDADIYAKAKED